MAGDWLWKLKPSMEVSREGLELIKRHEGFRAEAYRCLAGVWTVGYGHTGPEVQAGMRVTEQDAEALLRQDVRRAGRVVEAGCLRLRQNQFDALVSFVYNVGAAAFRSSTLLKRIRVDPDAPEIRSEFARWNKAKGRVLPGLVVRRKEEAELYFRKAGADGF